MRERERGERAEVCMSARIGGVPQIRGSTLLGFPIASSISPQQNDGAEFNLFGSVPTLTTELVNIIPPQQRQQQLREQQQLQQLRIVHIVLQLLAQRGSGAQFAEDLLRPPRSVC